MADVPDSIARYDEWVERLKKTPALQEARARRLKRRGRMLARRMWRMAIGLMLILVGAIGYGTAIAPLGFGGVALTVLLMALTLLFLARYPRDRDPVIEALPTVELKALPAQVEDWLDSQRRALPAPAAREIDQIMVQLDRLSPQLVQLEPGTAMAEEARRLISDHLPRLVRSYAEVPAAERAGPEATARLREGLKVVGSEIERMTTTIARERLDALEVEGKFLESRYSGTVGDGQKKPTR